MEVSEQAMQMCREEVSRKGKNKHKVPSGGPWWTVQETGSSGAMEGEDRRRGGPEVRGRSSAPRGDCGGPTGGLQADEGQDASGC